MKILRIKIEARYRIIITEALVTIGPLITTQMMRLPEPLFTLTASQLQYQSGDRVARCDLYLAIASRPFKKSSLN